jgi:hypothetical protein
MVDRIGFVPPSEATLPLHDIVHIFSETATHGLIRYRNLFKYERMNSFSKQNLKNRAHGVASIMKNYNVHERTTMSGCVYLDNVVKFASMCQLQPVNGLPFQSLGSILRSIHAEPPEETQDDRTTLYDIPSSNVIELRGDAFELTLGRHEINHLLEDNLDVCNEEGHSALQVILRAYKGHMVKYPTSEYDDDILGYIRRLLNNPHRYDKIIIRRQRRIRDEAERKLFQDDVSVLRQLAVDTDTPVVTVR